MKTLAILARQPGLAAAVEAELDAQRFRVVAHDLGDPANVLSLADSFDACLIDAEAGNGRIVALVQMLRRRLPTCPILIYVGDRRWEWEEEAYLLGVAHVLAKPVRGRLLSHLLDRLLPEHPPGPRAEPPTPAVSAGEPGQTSPPTIRALEAFRQFSRVLTHSLDSAALLDDFLRMLREIIGVNRAAIFLRPSPNVLSDPARGLESLTLNPECAIGISAARLSHFALSLEAGIGAHLFQRGRILRADSAEAEQDPKIRREFERLGIQVAIPIHDRETMLGVALLDGRLTGEPLSNAELTLLFHLLEELGLAIKNSWEHDLLAANREIMSDMLNELAAGCLVLNRNLAILHANSSVKRFLPQFGEGRKSLEFADLPGAIASRISEALNTGLAPTPFRLSPPEAPEAVFMITVTPFRQRGSAAVDAVLVLLEDFSQLERNQKLEIEASNLRLIKAMAEGLAHEIGNCLVPLATHQQLLRQKFDDPDFRLSLDSAMGEGVRRISRLSNQMLFLTRDAVGRAEVVPLGPLVEDAFREVQAWQNEKNALLVLEGGGRNYLTRGHRPALKHAVSELILNALQSNPAEPKVRVNLGAENDAEGRNWVRVEIRDTGKGFTSETMKRAFDPFYSTKNVGLGLGLTVARKIIETHGGRTELAAGGQPNAVAIFLLGDTTEVANPATKPAALTDTTAPRGKAVPGEA